MQPDGMLALMLWEEDTPYVYFFKHGLDEEKVVSIILLNSDFRCCVFSSVCLCGIVEYPLIILFLANILAEPVYLVAYYVQITQHWFL